uniref:t-SNARE coiled-coil homology domain-containing protein n=1 Tax=viral metagenome TaxID=1070528 RepID=A0A6C0KG39_9ZZZZ
MDEEKKEPYKNIEKDVMSLLESMKMLNNAVNQKQETIDTIEDFIESTKLDVEKGGEILDDTSQYTYAYTSYITGGISMAIAFFLFRNK